jgi:hypothetical protein
MRRSYSAAMLTGRLAFWALTLAVGLAAAACNQEKEGGPYAHTKEQDEMHARALARMAEARDAREKEERSGAAAAQVENAKSAHARAAVAEREKILDGRAETYRALSSTERMAAMRETCSASDGCDDSTATAIERGATTDAERSIVT